MNRSCSPVRVRLRKVASKSHRRDSPSSFDLLLGRRPFALEACLSYCFHLIATQDYQRDQECRLTPAMWAVAVPVLEARSCLSLVDLKPFELQELVDSFGLHP